MLLISAINDPQMPEPPRDWIVGVVTPLVAAIIGVIIGIWYERRSSRRYSLRDSITIIMPPLFEYVTFWATTMNDLYSRRADKWTVLKNEINRPRRGCHQQEIDTIESELIAISKTSQLISDKCHELRRHFRDLPGQFELLSAKALEGSTSEQTVRRLVETLNSDVKKLTDDTKSLLEMLKSSSRKDTKTKIDDIIGRIGNGTLR
jgi:hypothetical protein